MYMVEPVQMQQLDPWTGQIKSVEPDVIDEPSGVIDRMFRWSTQEVNIIRRPPPGVQIDHLSRPPALGGSRVFGGEPQVFAMGLDEAGVKAAIEAMEGLLTGNPDIAIGAMITGLAALGINVTMEILDYLMQISVADPETLTPQKWDDVLKEMRAHN